MANKGWLISVRVTRTKAWRYKTLGLVNNGLAVKTNMGKSEKFVVEQVEEWVKLLTVQHELSV
ncbi:MAG: hypothetical protein JWQ27_2169 [Ferruginibacter sp.]|nr:hypothetical protein [Ferruginibacter sp.]